MIPAMLVVSGIAVLWWILLWIAILGTATSTIYLVLTLLAAGRHRRLALVAQAKVDATAEASLPPVTILKPVHGAEQRLEENLESFFRQTYPRYEVIFGVRDVENPAYRVAQSVCARHPEIPSQIVISGPPEWPNAKVFSLDKMIAASAHSYFIISDSDVRVEPNFLQNMVIPLLDPKVGLITCMYRGVPAQDFWSSLEALGLSVEMSSGVMVADMIEGMRFALGPAMSARRDAIEAIGGIAATADYYSDDFELGKKIWSNGYRVLLSHHVVNNVLTPRSLLRTVGDQLRWMKSTRYSRPVGHVGTGLTYAVPFGILGLMAAGALGPWSLGLALFGVTYLNRAVQCAVIGRNVVHDPRAVSHSWLYPLRDLLGFFTWAASFTSRKFYWRGEMYRFEKGGRIAPLERPATEVLQKHT
jgi:ceramide glucosyltransferase